MGNFVWHYCQVKLIFKGQRADTLGSTQFEELRIR